MAAYLSNRQHSQRSVIILVAFRYAHMCSFVQNIAQLAESGHSSSVEQPTDEEPRLLHAAVSLLLQNAASAQTCTFDSGGRNRLLPGLGRADGRAVDCV
jgi:hypothetical protein